MIKCNKPFLILLNIILKLNAFMHANISIIYLGFRFR